MANVCEVGDPHEKAATTEIKTDDASAENKNPVGTVGKAD